MKRIKRFVLRHFEESIVVLVVAGVLAVAFLIQYKFSFLNFFFLPVILSGYYLGQKRGVLTSIFCILLVVFYLVFSDLLAGPGQEVSLDTIINIVTWGGFLILTGAVIGAASDQREKRAQSLRRAYVGTLEILLKYLEVADETCPHAVRVATRAGKMAEAVGLEKREVENIKSAALLYEAGDLRSSLPFFGEVVGFMAQEESPGGQKLGDRERVLLQSTASLLKEVEPILFHYYLHYVQEAHVLDKDLEKIPMGSSLLALADIYERITHQLPVVQEDEAYKSLAGVEKLAGRAFPPVAIYALKEATSGA